VGGHIRNRLASGGHGTPEWEFECKTIVGRLSFRCGLNTSEGTFNGLEGGVKEEFESDSNKTNCGSGKEDGTWTGELTMPHPASVGAIRVTE
jgi:hypothetical protein